MENIKYAELTDRIKAMFIDGIVLVAFMFFITEIFSSFQHVPTTARIAAFVFIYFLYEPFFVSVFGGTIGHFISGLRVKSDKNTRKNLWIHRALIRYFFKTILGVISLFTVSSNLKHQAIHDTISGAVVMKTRK